MRIINHWLERSPQWLILGLGLGLMLAIGAVDYVVTIDIALSIFYLLPIALVAWFTNPRYGLLFSILGSIIWIIAEQKAKVYQIFWLPYWNTGVRFIFFVIVTLLLCQIKFAYKQEQKFARTDELTGIVNRRFFWSIFALESKRALRYGRPLTLAYFDVDNFKSINDRWGHKKGDEVLQLIADIVATRIRVTDTIARLGGDEFALLLPESDYRSASLVLNRLQSEFNQTVRQQDLPISLSVGAITFQAIPDRLEITLDLVDRLMYQVKTTGKNDIKHEIYPSETAISPP